MQRWRRYARRSCRCWSSSTRTRPPTRLLIEPTPGGAGRGRARRPDRGSRAVLRRAGAPSPARRLPRHLPRLRRRPRPGRAGRLAARAEPAGQDRRPGPARAGSRQRLARSARLQTRPARADRRRHDRHRAVRRALRPPGDPRGARRRRDPRRRSPARPRRRRAEAAARQRPLTARGYSGHTAKRAFDGERDRELSPTGISFPDLLVKAILRPI